MYLELRPVSRPAKYGPEWDAYGLCDNQQWLSQSLGTDDSLSSRCEIVRQFLRTDPFHDRGKGEFREDLIQRDGRRFAVFLLLQAFLPTGNIRPGAQTIFIPTPESRDGRFVWQT